MTAEEIKAMYELALNSPPLGLKYAADTGCELPACRKTLGGTQTAGPPHIYFMHPIILVRSLVKTCNREQ